MTFGPFQKFVATMLCNRLGYQVQSVAIAWHIFTLHRAPLDLGLVGFTLFLPNALFSIPAGLVADRYERRTVVALAEVLSATTVAFLAAVTALRVDILWPYLVLLFFVGAGSAISAPSARSLLPNIVVREKFVAAQAQYSALRSFLQIIGPALGGFLTAQSTVGALGFSMLVMLLAAAIVMMLPPAEKPASQAPRPGWSGSLDGFKFIRSHPIIAGALSLDLFAVLFGGATALLPAFADSILHIGPVGLGVLRSAPALGAGLTAIVLARRPPRHNVGQTLLIAVAGFGFATIIFGLSRNVWLSLAALTVVGATDMVSVVVRNALVQLTTPDHMRGRVSAFENIFIGASNELGEFESGTLAAWIGIVPAVVAGGVGTLIVIAVWAALFPALRKSHDVYSVVES